MSKSIHILVVGKLKDLNFTSLEKEYLKRLKSFNIKIHEIKNKLSQEEEFQLLIKKIDLLKKDNSNTEVLPLTEFGNVYNSIDFSNLIFEKLLNKNICPLFVIGGAYGIDKRILQSYRNNISLSNLTFPHKLARLILIEQIYRAWTININHPYHNE